MPLASNLKNKNKKAKGKHNLVYKKNLIQSLTVKIKTETDRQIDR